MSDHAESAHSGLTLYDALGAPEPCTAGLGETMRTTAKETIDNDRENDLAAILLDLA